jgi:hypothetical protein
VSASHLPDDLAAWPADPFAVLGVRPGVDAKELRRAYTSLIRVFKPEHRPDHFRRIREAFEFAQRHSTYFRFEPQVEPEPPADPTTDADAPAGSRPRIVLPDDLWQRAVRGEIAEAYQGLRTEVERSPNRADNYARLYWLATTDPELDSDRPAAEWLTRGLSAAGFPGMLLELYRGELLNNPAEAGSPRAAKLMSESHPPDGVATLTRHRWQAFARLGRWSSIADEFDTARQLLAADESAWLGLVIDLRTWIAFDRDDLVAGGLARMASAEARSMEHLALRQGGLFDQLDWLKAVGRSCERLRQIDRRAATLADLLRDSWLLPAELIRGPMEAALARISDDPFGWVEVFDRGRRDVIAALNQFGNLLEHYQAAARIDAELPHSWATLRRLATDALGDPGQSLGLFRGRALRLCLDECVDPQLIRTAFHPSFGGPHVLPGWVDTLANDAPVHLVCWACRLFRA